MKNYHIRIDKQEGVQVGKRNETFIVDGEAFSPDIISTGEGCYNVLFRGRSYNVEVLRTDPGACTGELKVNGKLCRFSARDRFDELLEKMGMAGEAARPVNDLKAPMPGLVLEILTGPGQEVRKGENLLVLEAMKMENIIKSSGNGVVAAVTVAPGQSVEKGQVLIRFE